MITNTFKMNLNKKEENKRKISLICIRKLLLLRIIESEFGEHTRIFLVYIYILIEKLILFTS